MENCIWCEKEIDSSSKVACQNCKKPYHRECIESEDRKDETGKHQCGHCNMEFTPLNCEIPLVEPAAPKSKRPQSRKSRSVITSSSRSSKASRAELELKLLEEQHQLELKQLQLKMDLEKTFLAKKAEILRKAEESQSGEDEQEQEEMNERAMAALRVQNWKISTLKDGAPSSMPPHSEPEITIQEQMKKKDENDSHSKEQVNHKASIAAHSKSPGYIITDNTNLQAENNNASDVPISSAINVGTTKPEQSDENVNIHRDSNVKLSTSATDKNNATGNSNPLTSGNDTILTPTSLSKEAIAARKINESLPIFDGQSRKWPKFYGAFVNSTKLCEFNHYDNLARLEKCLKKSAYTAVEGLMSYPNNVPQIIKTLELYFGQPEFIIQDLIDDIYSKPSPKLEKAGTLIEFSIAVNNAVQTMISSEMTEHLWNPVLLKDIIGKLPTNMQYDWAEFKIDSGTKTNLEGFNQWLQRKSIVAARLLTKAPVLNDNTKRQSRTDALYTHSEEKECIFCPKNCPDAAGCEEFKSMAYEERWKIVNEKKLCRVCLKRHRGRCNSAACSVPACTYRHHTLLHKQNQLPHSVNSHYFESDRKLFKILPVKLHHKGKCINTFAMLDDASSVTLMENQLAKKLELKGIPQSLCLKWTAGTTRDEHFSKIVSVHISAHGDKNKTFFMENVRTVDKLSLPVQSLSMEIFSEKYEHLRNLPIESYKDATPEILIGLDNAKLLLSSSVKAGDDKQPIAIKTLIGWVVFGVDRATDDYVFHICECNHDSELNSLVEQFLAVNDSFVATPKSMISKDDEQALEMMKSTISEQNGHYQCRLLWKSSSVFTPDSLEMCKRRFECFERKIKKQPHLSEKLADIIKDYESKGYIRKLSEADIESHSGRKWYLPIFLVQNPNKPAKTRLVWDAAAMSKGSSLNSLLLKGPDQISSLTGVLTRFRQRKVALCGDIREMFHQVKVHPEDQHCQRFLYRKDPSCEFETYVMTVMTFGACCSPAIAQFVKNSNADKFINKFPRAVDCIKLNHYVDDLLDSFQTEDEAVRVANEVATIHQNAGFVIKSWLSNSRKVMTSLNQSESNTSFEIDLHSELPTEKVLGMWWRVETDTFTYSLKYSKGNEDVLKGNAVPTKRELLRVIMSVFDPLGLLSHFLIFPRVLMQEVWRRKTSWDEEISEDQFEEWKQWVQSLPLIETVSIPRCFLATTFSDVQLHVFSDASEDAYASAVYLRFSTSDGISCSLVCAKCRVAPTKPQTIPRLELQAATMSVRLATTVIGQISLPVARSFYWTDSKTVICWIRSDARRYRPYVSSRISEILELTKEEQWSYVPSKQNPADAATRKKIPTPNIDSTWFLGPSFLYEEEESWPSTSTNPSTTNIELRPKFCEVLNFHSLEVDSNRFSSWSRLLRSTAFAVRFVNIIKARVHKSSVPSGPLSRDELSNAEDFLISQSQLENFDEEMSTLKKNSLLPRKNPLYNLMPFLDDKGILRSRGRLGFVEEADFNLQAPIILAANDSITELIIKNCHAVTYKHDFDESVVNEIKQKFYINNLRTTLKKIIRRCQYCKNQKAKPYAPPMADVPSCRTQMNCRPFSYVGIDYFGPIIVTVARHTEKRWGVLITDLTIRAIHMELVPTLTTSSCIMALRRFCGRRGSPVEMYSDNATTFKGASKELREAVEALDQKELHEKFVSTTTTWFFIPPASPHMGGAWERMIRSVKSSLYKILPSRKPNDEVLNTLIVEVEAIINSRPLTYLPTETNHESLTPNHFIYGSSNGLRGLGPMTDEKDVLINNWHKSQQLANKFWARWRKEYLPQLNRRCKWFTPCRQIKKGDIVILLEENSERNVWPKGLVVDVKVSRDGLVRSATVKTSSGIYERPVVKMALLDVMEAVVPGNILETTPGRTVNDTLQPEENLINRQE